VFLSPHAFSTIIERNTPLPVNRTEIYSTVVDDQPSAQIRVFQGENQDTRYNTLVGEFDIEGLAEVPSGNQILVRLDLDLNGILKVTATERATGLAKHVVIDSATERFRRSQSTSAVDRLEAVFGTLEHPYEPLGALAGPHQNLEPSGTSSDDLMTPSLRQAVESAQALVAKAKGLESDANDEDAEELRAMLVDLQAAVERGSEDDIRVALREVEELVFYLEDA
jgi:molecular chaperone DnaK